MRLAEDARRAGFRLISFDALGSTNDEALARAAAGDRGRLWVTAAAQTAGRGRQGRAWSSPSGNLYASLLLVDAVPPSKAWQLGFVAGVALADAVTDLIGDALKIAIKWPNDLLAGEAKVAGILSEASRTRSGAFACVIGIGVNRAVHPEGTPYPVTDIFALSDARPSLDDLFAALSARMAETLELWSAGQNFPGIREAWLQRALSPGTPLSVGVKAGRQTGRFQTIDADGRLVLTTDDGPVVLDVGDVIVMNLPATAG